MFSPLQLQEFSRAVTFKKLTCLLMMGMFSIEELTTCSVTGKKGKSKDENEKPRPRLDPTKVNFIIGMLEGLLDTFTTTFSNLKMARTRYGSPAHYSHGSSSAPVLASVGDTGIDGPLYIDEPAKPSFAAVSLAAARIGCFRCTSSIYGHLGSTGPVPPHPGRTNACRCSHVG